MAVEVMLMAMMPVLHHENAAEQDEQLALLTHGPAAGAAGEGEQVPSAHTGAAEDGDVHGQTREQSAAPVVDPQRADDQGIVPEVEAHGHHAVSCPEIFM
jgi:hypothetical protein